MADHPLLVYLFIACAILVLTGGGILLRFDGQSRRLHGRVAAIARGEQAQTPQPSFVLTALTGLGEWIRRGGRLYSAADIEQLQGLVVSTGLDPQRVLPLLLGTKLALMLGLPLASLSFSALAHQSGTTRFAIAAVALVLGLLGPDWLLGALRRAHNRKIERGLPDALDLLVMCSEAGMALESAIERVAQDMPRANKPMAVALSNLLDDLRVLPDRAEAFQKFGRRTGVEGVQRLAAVLAQALQLGTPLGQTLRAVATELRRDRMNRLEAQAVRLPVKLVMPLMLFMLPSLWIILAGGSFLRMFDALGAIMVHIPPTLSHH